MTEVLKPRSLFFSKNSDFLLYDSCFFRYIYEGLRKDAKSLPLGERKEIYEKLSWKQDTQLVRGTPLTPRLYREKEVRKMNRGKKEDSRDYFIKYRVSREELDAINKKFKNSCMKSRSDFLRTMTLEGHIVIFSETELREIRRLMTTIANNFNQIARRANSSGSVYEKDIAEIREEINRLWQPLNYFQSQLLRLKR